MTRLLRLIARIFVFVPVELYPVDPWEDTTR